jgi:hypothetical protein
MEFTNYTRGNTVKRALIKNTNDFSDREVLEFAAKRMGETIADNPMRDNGSTFGTYIVRYDGETYLEIYID